MERPSLKNIKDKNVLEYIDHLEGQLKTPYYDAFMSLKMMVDEGNRQLKSIKFDVFSPDGEAKFKQAAKFSSQLKEWFAQMEYFKSKMNPEEQRKAMQEQEISPVERQKQKVNAGTTKI